MLIESAIAVVSGFGIGNFIYARFRSRNYGQALERSLLQALAIATYMVALQIIR